MRIDIPTLQHTQKLGEALASVWADSPEQAVLLLLQGEMGAGKTTLIRFMVAKMPGGDLAEVSSPSFTLCNIYPTLPPVWHFDLYRLEDGQYDDSLPEAMEAAEGDPALIVVEWPERMPKTILPAQFIHCRLTESENNRRASFEGYGNTAAVLLEKIRVAAEIGGLAVTK